MMFMTFGLAFAFMLTKHVLLTLVAISTLPLVYVFGVKLRKVMFPLSWVVQGRLADVATTVEENVTGVRVVKSFAGERGQIEQLARHARRLQWSAVKVADSRAKYAPLMENLPRLGMALTVLYGGYLAIDGQVTIGVIIAFSSYVLMLQAPFRMLGFFMIMSQRAAASAGRIFEILDTPAEIIDRPGAVDLVDPKGRIDFDHVRFRYGDDPTDTGDGSNDSTTTAPAATSSPTSTSTSSRARPSPWSAAPDRASPPSPASCCASTTSTTARSASTATTSAT